MARPGAGDDGGAMGDDPKRVPGRALRWALVGLVAVLFAAGAVRAGLYLVYAARMLTFPLEAHQLESKMVLLAWRAQHGLSLYPEWRDYPHVANFFAPLDFLLVGGIGRLVEADLRGLFLIGRGVSFAAGMLEAVVLGVWAGRRYGPFAGVLGATLTLGTIAMTGFSVSTRPDMLAELLGLVGFILCGERSPGRRAAGVAALVLAALTKQTAGVYLVAAALAAVAERRRRWGLAIVGGGVGAIALVVAGATLSVEPNFARSLVGEAATPRDLGAWFDLLERLAYGSADLLLLPTLGLVLWTRTRYRDPRLAALTATLMVVALVTSMKRGADTNYFLGLRAPEAMAAATLWAAAREAASRRQALALAAALASATAVMIMSVLSITLFTARIIGTADFFEGPRGRAVAAAYRDAAHVAASPGARMLTDSGFIDIHARDRAVFGDPWLFRMLVDTGRIVPRVLIERIDSGYYETVITTADLGLPEYETNAFGLPMVLVERLRGRYGLVRSGNGLFVYRRRDRGGVGAR